MADRPAADLSGYFDACATTPPSPGVLAAMAQAHTVAWANPSSLHGPGLAAAELLERSRRRLAVCLGAGEHDLIFTSGATESIQLALLGAAAAMAPGRLLISAVEHPATVAAAAELQRRGWSVAVAPVDRQGRVLEERFAALLAPPTRLVSLIWGQSEVGTLQDLERLGRLCQQAGVPLHVDAVQVVGHLPLEFAALPLQLLSCTAHKLRGPRGIGLLLRRSGLPLLPLIGGSQEGGLRGGTEPVVLAAGFAQALHEACERLERRGGLEPVAALRDQLLAALLALPGVERTGPEPVAGERLPHHLSLILRDGSGQPIAGRSLVRRLWQQGVAVSSGSACSSGGSAASPVLRALGYDEQEAGAGLRFSLGAWHRREDLERLPAALDRARGDASGGS